MGTCPVPPWSPGRGPLGPPAVLSRLSEVAKQPREGPCGLFRDRGQGTHAEGPGGYLGEHGWHTGKNWCLCQKARLGCGLRGTATATHNCQGSRGLTERCGKAGGLGGPSLSAAAGALSLAPAERPRGCNPQGDSLGLGGSPASCSTSHSLRAGPASMPKAGPARPSGAPAAPGCACSRRVASTPAGGPSHTRAPTLAGPPLP